MHTCTHTGYPEQEEVYSEQEENPEDGHPEDGHSYHEEGCLYLEEEGHSYHEELFWTDDIPVPHETTSALQLYTIKGLSSHQRRREGMQLP